MKKAVIGIALAAALLLSFHSPAQAASARSVGGNEYLCLGVMVGLVNGYVPVARPILDRFSFSDPFFSFGFLAIDGLNDASGTYTIEDDDFGLERITASCSAYDSERDLYLHFEIHAVNLIDLGLIGTMEVDGDINGDDAGSAIGVFFGIRNILD